MDTKTPALVGLLALGLVGGCEPRTTPSPPPPVADAGGADAAQDAGARDAGRDTGGPTDRPRELVERVPDPDWIRSRVEDPDFSFSTRSWFAVDGLGAPQKVTRRYTSDGPEGRPYVGLEPLANRSSCVLGRVKWGRAAPQRASLWIADGQPVEAVVFAMEVAGETAALRRYPLSPTGATHQEGDGRTWREHAAVVSPSFGWGFLQVCHSGPEVAWVGAPKAVDMGMGAGAVVRLPEGRDATVAELDRIRQMDAWRREAPRPNE
jgi:hypothetical protein